MATIRKRNGKWQIHVRRTGHPTQTKSFLPKPDAQKWGDVAQSTGEDRGRVGGQR